MSIESLLRKHITRETHKGTHARIVTQLAESIRKEILKEVEERCEKDKEEICVRCHRGFQLEIKKPKGFTECSWCGIQLFTAEITDETRWNDARTSIIEIIKGL